MSYKHNKNNIYNINGICVIICLKLYHIQTICKFIFESYHF